MCVECVHDKIVEIAMAKLESSEAVLDAFDFAGTSREEAMDGVLDRCHTERATMAAYALFETRWPEGSWGR